MAARVCLKHRLADGTIEDCKIIGDHPHGPGINCVEYGTGAYKTGGKVKNFRFKGKSKPTAKDYSAGGKYSVGGYLMGPSHEEGGIQAIVDGTEPIEVEGGEFVINKKTVEAVGEDFLHRLNSTSTPYHDSNDGFGEGILPSPSIYADGGTIHSRRDNMRKIPRSRRGSINAGRRPARGGSKRMARGGRTRPVPARRGSRRTFGGGGRACMPGTPGCNQNSGYRGGGRAVGRNRRMPGGGGMYASPNTACTMLTSAIDCSNSPGCTWNPDGPSCH